MKNTGLCGKPHKGLIEELRRRGFPLVRVKTVAFVLLGCLMGGSAFAWNREETITQNDTRTSSVRVEMGIYSRDTDKWSVVVPAGKQANVTVTRTSLSANHTATSSGKASVDSQTIQLTSSEPQAKFVLTKTGVVYVSVSATGGSYLEFSSDFTKFREVYYTDWYATLSYSISVEYVEAAPPIDMNKALDNEELVFTTGGAADWFGQSKTSHDGSNAVQSGTIANDQESWLQTTVTGPGILSFWWYVSSESVKYDYLSFSIDGVEMEKIGGTDVDWAQCAYPVEAGAHTLKWTYKKDGSQSKGLDAGLVDQVVWTSAETYTIKFVKNEGSGQVVSREFMSGVKTRLPAIKNGLKWERRGYEFKGWATSTANARAGKVWKADWANVSQAIGSGKTLTVYAVWKLKPGFYEIKFNKNDGSGKWRTVAYEYDVKTRIPTVRNGLGWFVSGYKFGGWALSARGKKWKDDWAYVATPVKAGETLNAYAIWL